MNQTIRQRKALHHGLVMIDQKYRQNNPNTACDRRYFLVLAAVIFIAAVMG
jgi:hypothetical protein